MNRSVNASSTFVELSLRSTRMISASFVCSSLDQCSRTNGEPGLGVEGAIGPPISSAILDEVVGPDVGGLLGTQTYARSVALPKPPSLLLLLRDLQPFTSPDALNVYLAGDLHSNSAERGPALFSKPVIIRYP